MRLFNRPMTTRERERWGRIRTGGKRRYVLLYGVLGWGLTTALLFLVIKQWSTGNASLQGFISRSFLIEAAIAVVVFPLTGSLWGLYMWSFFERRYAREPHSP